VVVSSFWQRTGAWIRSIRVFLESVVEEFLVIGLHKVANPSFGYIKYRFIFPIAFFGSIYFNIDLWKNNLNNTYIVAYNIFTKLAIPYLEVVIHLIFNL